MGGAETGPLGQPSRLGLTNRGPLTIMLTVRETLHRLHTERTPATLTRRRLVKVGRGCLPPPRAGDSGRPDADAIAASPPKRRLFPPET